MKWEFLKKKSPAGRRKGQNPGGSQIRNFPGDVEIETNLKENTWHWDSAGQVATPAGPALPSVSLCNPYLHVKTLKIDLDGQGSLNVFVPLTSVAILKSISFLACIIF